MDLALIALSTRPLAASAARAGFATLSLDLYANLDTCAHTARCVRVHKRNGAFDADDLIQALTSLSPPGLPVVLGGGLEDDLPLMTRIAERNPILGNSPQTVRVLKDPIAFAALCGHLQIPVPAISFAPGDPALGSGTVIQKKIGGAGGVHIRRRRAGETTPVPDGYYLQRELAGEPYSLLLIANGRRALVIGGAKQWRADDGAHPFRYGGAVGPVTLPLAHGLGMHDAAVKLACAGGLVGLISMDFIVGEDGWHLVEVNPRLGALLDIFDTDPLPPLMGLHIAACGGKLPEALPSPSEVHATCVVYADRDVLVPQGTWPEHVADRPPAGAAIASGSAICTVRTTAPSEEMALERLDALCRDVRTRLGLAEVPEPAH